MVWKSWFSIFIELIDNSGSGDGKMLFRIIRHMLVTVFIVFVIPEIASLGAIYCVRVFYRPILALLPG